MGYGARMREARLKAGMSLEQLSRKSKRSLWTILRLEQEKHWPTAAVRDDIARALKTTPKELFGTHPEIEDE